MPRLRCAIWILLSLSATSVLGQSSGSSSDRAASGITPRPQQISLPPGSKIPMPEAIPAPVEVSREGLPGDGSMPESVELTIDATDSPGQRDALDAFWGYRYSENVFGWMIGNGDQFGDVMLASSRYLAAGIGTGFGAGVAFHWLAGPDTTDMPPMVYDFSLGYQMRDQWGDLRYDLACAVLAASDFEGSARQGIRLPAHAVGYLALTDKIDLAFGAEYLDRADISVLPVAGLVWLPDPDVRLEILFPHPRAYIQLTDRHRLFLKGDLGGGSWAVERDSEEDDLATYYDLRIGLGVEKRAEEGRWESLEVLYLFDRKLDFTSGSGDYRPNGTIMLRSVASY